MNRLLKKFFDITSCMLAVATLLVAQSRKEFQPFSSGLIQIEKNILPSDSGLVCYLSYRIPYSSLIFVKNGRGFNAGLTLNCDIKSGGKVVERKSTSNSVTIASYDSTNSANDFLQGAVKIKCDSKNLVVLPYLNIKNSNRNFELDSINIDATKALKQKVMPPLIVKRNGSLCSPNAVLELVNFSNSIPFSPNEYRLLIPVTDSTINQINVKLAQEDNEVFINRNLFESFRNELVIKECNPVVVVEKGKTSHNVKYFVVDGFSPRLKEGYLKITISVNDKVIEEFESKVVWENKPRTLMNPEFAIQILNVIEPNEKVDTLLSGDKKYYYKVLTNYWDAKRTDKSAAFNALESEFYKRADYALTHFASLNNKNGVKTDRGKVYIQFGKPDEVKREYSESNYVMEIWIYKRLNQEFVFADKTGLGNYTLEK